MNKIFLRVGLLFAGLVMISTFFGGMCDSDDEPVEPDKCGPIVQKYKKWINTGNLDPADHYIYSEEGLAIYEYAIELIDDVCAHQHIKGRFEVEKYINTSLIYQAEVVYGLFNTYPITDWTLDEYGDAGLATGKFELGMKSVYGDEPGWLLPILKIYFAEGASLEETHEAFKEGVNHVLIEYEYYQWKDNS